MLQGLQSKKVTHNCTRDDTIEKFDCQMSNMHTQEKVQVDIISIHNGKGKKHPLPENIWHNFPQLQHRNKHISRAK